MNGNWKFFSESDSTNEVWSSDKKLEWTGKIKHPNFPTYGRQEAHDFWRENLVLLSRPFTMCDKARFWLALGASPLGSAEIQSSKACKPDLFVSLFL